MPFPSAYKPDFSGGFARRERVEKKNHPVDRAGGAARRPLRLRKSAGTGRYPRPVRSGPQEHTPDGTAELERLPLPKGYAPLTAPAAAGPSEKDVRQYAYEDLADPHRPAIDLSGIPDRLWPGGGYESSEQTDGKTFTFTGDDGRQELLYWDDRYAMYVRNDTAIQNLTTGAEELMERTRAELTELLGSDAYFSHPQPTDETFYLRNSIKRVENTQVFLWDQTVDGIPVESHQLTAIATEEGILGFTLRWGVMEPLDAPMPGLLTAEEALYSLNYARSQQNTGTALSKLEKILHVQLVYSSRFAERPNLYQPAWQFAPTPRTPKQTSCWWTPPPAMCSAIMTGGWILPIRSFPAARWRWQNRGFPIRKRRPC